jgi:predicted P-loop ATPase
MDNGLLTVLEYANAKIKAGQDFMIQADDAWDIRLTEEQKANINGGIKQLIAIRDIIKEIKRDEENEQPQEY